MFVCVQNYLDVNMIYITIAESVNVNDILRMYNMLVEYVHVDYVIATDKTLTVFLQLNHDYICTRRHRDGDGANTYKRNL